MWNQVDRKRPNTDVTNIGKDPLCFLYHRLWCREERVVSNTRWRSSSRRPSFTRPYISLRAWTLEDHSPHLMLDRGRAYFDRWNRQLLTVHTLDWWSQTPRGYLFQVDMKFSGTKSGSPAQCT